MYSQNRMLLLPLLCLMNTAHALPMAFCSRTDPRETRFPRYAPLRAQAAVIYEIFLILVENAKHLSGQMKTTQQTELDNQWWMYQYLVSKHFLVQSKVTVNMINFNSGKLQGEVDDSPLEHKG